MNDAEHTPDGEDKCTEHLPRDGASPSERLRGDEVMPLFERGQGDGADTLSMRLPRDKGASLFPLLPIDDHADPFERLRALAGPDAGLVVDGGANKGRTVERLLALFPKARVVAYEPQPRLARKLAKRFADYPAVGVRRAALGSRRGILGLNVLESPTCSSLLAPLAIREKHAGRPMGVAQVVEVEIVRLDEDLDRPPEVVKLDLQGYELEALKGTEGLLGGVRAVLCELSFRELYAGQPLGEEVIDWMRSRGFRLDGLYCPWRDGDSLVAADALFVRSGM